MEEILSEKDLVTNGNCWGQWTFSLPDERIREKVESLPRFKDVHNCSHWAQLFSLTQSKSDIEELNCGLNTKTPASSQNHSPMEISEVVDPKDELCESIVSSSIEELSVCLVDLCNQLGPKLRSGVREVQEEMKSLASYLKNSKGESLALLMENTWPQLHSDACKLCFCIPFCTSSDLCRTLCRRILLPWMSKSLPSKLEQLSTILAAEADTVCVSLVAPLLRLEGSPLVLDLLNLEDLMGSMAPKHWTVLLRELLSESEDLQKWQIPALATVVQHAEPTCDDLFALVQLMSSTGTTFAQSKEFGALLVAVANHLKVDSSSLVPQLKLIANNYKGSLKFKVLKVLADMN
uniref:Fanconi Anaemia group E protein C-terminal domain-containing protein n=1 Tax=Graphocephala atropunctata TaxID=36148 RepID=A0A1B6KBD5_9HEMI